MKYIFFKNERHLLQALQMCCKTDMFPPDVNKTTDKREYSLPVDIFTSEEHLNKLSKQCGWEVRISETIPSKYHILLLRDILGGVFEYEDPLPLNLNSDGQACDEICLDPSFAKRKYLIAANNEEMSVRILDSLTAFFTNQIKARPIYINNKKRDIPYPFFWIVEGKQPALPILENSARAWWGPFGGKRIEIYLEWPYKLQIPDECLIRIPWPEKARVILLSREEPKFIILDLDKDETVFRELIDVSSIKDMNSHSAEVTPESFNETDLNFEVELRMLKDNDPKKIYENCISDLKSEIKAKEELLNEMEDEINADDTFEFEPQPLFLYISNRTEIPFRIKQLIIEWTDQENDLKMLRYMKITGLPLLPIDLYEDKYVHVLTTSSAIGMGNSGNVNLKLRKYRPSIGKYVHFELLQEWAQFGLFLFLPNGENLSIYPELPVCPLAAKKLAKALLIKGDKSDWKEVITLLVPSDSGGIMACRLQNSDFKPLSESFEWNCVIDVPVSSLLKVKEIAKETKEEMLISIEEAFSEVINKEAKKRVKKILDEFKRKIEDILSKIENLQQEYEGLQDAREKLDEDLKNVYKETQKECHQAKSDLKDITDNLGTHIKELNSMQADLKEVEARIQETAQINSKLGYLREEIDSLLDKTKQYSRKDKI